MVYLCRLSTCNLDQWSLDFDLNLANVLESIKQAKVAGARYRTGPELELAGYGCEDHFLEPDTEHHCWQSILALLRSGLTDGFLCDIGMPVSHRGVRYNCRVVLLDSKIVLIRPKIWMANDGNYRELRYFSSWPSYTHDNLEPFTMPVAIREFTGARTCPIGVCILSLNDSSLAWETCEELFTPQSPHVALTLGGAEIISNSSGSHHTLRKLSTRIDLISNASSKSACAYLYSNQQGCDGGRLYYDGSACIYNNGAMVAQSSQFSVKDIEVITATIDLDDLRSKRTSIPSRANQAALLNHSATRIPTISIDYNIGGDQFSLVVSPVISPRIHSVEEEIGLGPACWLWDYLRRSKMAGFFLPLSGGADSAATATIVAYMCHLLVDAAVHDQDQRTIGDLARILPRREGGEHIERDDGLPAHFPFPFTPKSLANVLFHTAYLATDNSGQVTRDRAAKLAEEIGAYHLNVNLQSIVDACVGTIKLALKLALRYKVHGGDPAENLALQNLQARCRMVISYALASLLPLVRQHKGSLLVLGSGNVDEALRGYLTKYDCSSADLNPIGAVSKRDLKAFLRWAGSKFGYTALLDVVEATPTAELEPTTASYTQSDEADMGMSYEELGDYGRLRSIHRCGPVSMFEKLREWTVTRALPLTEVGDKVKRFFYYYAINRHKCTVLTPAYHAENYSPDDHRFDHRPFLYNAAWTRQFDEIDQRIQRELETKEQQPASHPAASARAKQV